MSAPQAGVRYFVSRNSTTGIWCKTREVADRLCTKRNSRQPKYKTYRVYRAALEKETL